MKIHTIMMAAASLFLASCTINRNYYILASDEAAIEKLKTQFAIGSSNVSVIAPEVSKDVIKYDDAAPTHISRLVLSKEVGEEGKPVYGNVQTVKPVHDYSDQTSYAIWCTKEATYLAHVVSLGWTETDHYPINNMYVRDCATGRIYRPTGNWGLPLDKEVNIQGVPGQYGCLVAEFPALPPTCTTIDIIVGGDENNYRNVKGVFVKTLQANQSISDYKKTKIIE